MAAKCDGALASASAYSAKSALEPELLDLDVRRGQLIHCGLQALPEAAAHAPALDRGDAIAGGNPFAVVPFAAVAASDPASLRGWGALCPRDAGTD